MAGSTTAQQLADAVPSRLRRRLYSARELDRRRAETLRTRKLHVPALDRLLGGAARRGGLIEIIGRPGSGRFSLALASLAAVTSSGEVAALIDLGDMLDPENAAESGIDLTRLLWVRPRHLKPALAAAESVVGAGFPLVVIDLGLPPVPGGRGIETAWLRLSRATARHELVSIVSAPYRVSGTAATAVLRAGRNRGVWNGTGAAPPLLTGLRSHLTLVKARHRELPVDTVSMEMISLDAATNPPGESSSSPRSSAAPEASCLP